MSIFFWFTNSTVLSRPDFLFSLQLLINLRIQCDILKALCESALCCIRSKSSWISTDVMTSEIQNLNFFFRLYSWYHRFPKFCWPCFERAGCNSHAHLTRVALPYYRFILLQILHFNFLILILRLKSGYMPCV